MEYSYASLPEDEFGFTTDDRIRIASQVLNYFQNDAPIETIEQLERDERDHLEDVKSLLQLAYVVLILSFVVFLIAFVFLFSHTTYRSKAFLAVQRGTQVTLASIFFIGILFFLFWYNAFQTFHKIFFEKSTWMFEDDATLLRVFPDPFWQDVVFYYFSIIGLLSMFLILVCSRWKRR